MPDPFAFGVQPDKDGQFVLYEKGKEVAAYPTAEAAINAVCIEAYARLCASQARVRALEIALTESVKLQSHYAGLLNIYDGGQRMQFETADAWIDRLAALQSKEGE